MPKKAPEKIGSVLRVPLSQLHPHPQNPFAVRDDSAMQELKESVSQNGVLVPAIARPRAEGGYQPICPLVMHSLFLRDAIPQEHKDDLDMSKDYLYRASLLVVCEAR